MSKTNCVNCGAGKETTDLQCPFCGTKYADFTTFDLMSNEPIYIQLKKGDGIVTAKAYITDRTLTFHPEYLDVSDVSGRRKMLNLGMHVNGSIDFTMYERL